MTTETIISAPDNSLSNYGVDAQGNIVFMPGVTAATK